MGVSVYYTCVREYPFTNQEKQEVAAVINRYNRAFDMKDSGETFSMYRYDENTPTVIFEGATKLPFSDDIDELLTALFYWLSCLTEIRRSVSSGQWHVHLDDTDAIWDEETGWQMPMD